MNRDAVQTDLDRDKVRCNIKSDTPSMWSDLVGNIFLGKFLEDTSIFLLGH